MQKLTLLLIPLILLSSCTIDWSNSKTTRNNVGSCENIPGGTCTFEKICNSPDNMYITETHIHDLLSYGYSKSGYSIFYFRDTADKFNERQKSNINKGFRFSFWEYDCIKKEEKMIVSEETAGKILNLLPNNDPDFYYYPEVTGADTYSYFNKILRFQYRQGFDIGGAQGDYNITLNTHDHTILIDGFSDTKWNDTIGGYDKIKFSTGYQDFY